MNTIKCRLFSSSHNLDTVKGLNVKNNVNHELKNARPIHNELKGRR